MNEYETQTNTKGQNVSFVNGKKIDPYKNSIKCGISGYLKIMVKNLIMWKL